MKFEQKLITCIVPEANAVKGAEALRDSYDLQTISHHFARGVGKSNPLALRGIGEKTEKVVLSVVVEAGQADEIFEFLFHETEIDRPKGGMIFMKRVQMAGTPVENTTDATAGTTDQGEA